MPEDSPQVRGRHMETFLEVIDRLGEDDRDAIRYAIPPEMLRAIEEASSVSWLPAEINLKVTNIVAERLGKERAHRFFCDLLLAGFETPLLGSFVKGALRLAGANPGFSLKWVPKGFSLVFRNVGEWNTFDVTDTSATVEVTGLPSIMARDHVWLDSVASSLQALFEMVAKQGEIKVASVEEARRRASFKATWPA